jgi:hypothetical protein
MAFFASVRQDHLDKEAPKELHRTGHALDDSPESKSKAIRAIQASLGAESTGKMTRQVLDWLKAQPTKTSYIVAQDGSGDFTTIAAANQHIDSVMGGLEEPDRKEAAFLIEVRPGLYREKVTLSRSRVELRGTMGEKRSVIEAPDDGTAINITADDVTLASLTIKSATKTAATVNVTASSARIVGNWIFGGTEDYCGLNVGGSLKRERFDLPYDAVRGKDTLSGFAARNGVPSTGELEKLNPNVVWFREKVLRTAAFPWELDKPSPPRVMVHGNTFSGGCGVLTFEKGAPDIGSNTFLVSRHAIVARGESTPVIFPNNYTAAGGNAVLAVDSSEVRITGKQWRGALKNAALIAADDQAVVWLAPSALMSPDPCLSLTGTSSAKVTRTSFRCSTPVLATSQTQLNIGDSRFEYNPYRGVDPWNYINRGSGAKVEVNETEVENAPPLTGTFSTTST